jgi:hypothetical protein
MYVCMYVVCVYSERKDRGVTEEERAGGTDRGATRRSYTYRQWHEGTQVYDQFVTHEARRLKRLSSGGRRLDPGGACVNAIEGVPYDRRCSLTIECACVDVDLHTHYAMLL